MKLQKSMEKEQKNEDINLDNEEKQINNNDE